MHPDMKNFWIIDDFPPGYENKYTPYAQNDFSKEVKHTLHGQTTFTDGIVCKTIFIGDVSVGKTTIVNRFCYDKFEHSYKATIGVDFEIETFKVLGQQYDLQIWDTAGQERFKCIAQAYYRNSNVIIIVFDMTKDKTLNEVTSWLESALTVNTIQKPLLFLVGCKSDLLDEEVFQAVERNAIDIAKGMQAEYWSVSAKTGANIVPLFRRIAALSFESLIKLQMMEKSGCMKRDRRALRLELEKENQKRCKGCSC